MTADRFPVIVGGERGGKTEVLAKIMLPHILALPYLRRERFFYPSGKLRYDPKVNKPRNPDFTLFGPTYAKPKVEFERLEDDLRRLNMISGTPSKSDNAAWRMVTTDGVVITTFSLQDPESVAAIDLEGAGVCEAGACPYAGIERIRGRVASKRGFIVYSGTIERSQQWWKDWILEGQRPNEKGIVSYSIPSWTNRSQFPGGYDDPEIQSWRSFLGEDLFLERCAAQPRPPRERVMSEAKPEHIVDDIAIPEDAHHEIWVDPGYATAYAVLFVAWWLDKKGRPFFYGYDEFYEQRVDTEGMIQLCEQKPTFRRVKKGVIDVGATAHRDATKSSLEVWQKGTDIQWERKIWPEAVQIERIQTCLRNGQFRWHSRCKGLSAEWGLGEPVFPEMHPWKFQTDRDGRITGEKPKDAWNHASKCVSYGLLNHLGQASHRREYKAKNRLRPEGRPKPRLGGLTQADRDAMFDAMR